MFVTHWLFFDFGQHHLTLLPILNTWTHDWPHLTRVLDLGFWLDDCPTSSARPAASSFSNTENLQFPPWVSGYLYFREEQRTQSTSTTKQCGTSKLATGESFRLALSAGVTDIVLKPVTCHLLPVLFWLLQWCELWTQRSHKLLLHQQALHLRGEILANEVYTSYFF